MKKIILLSALCASFQSALSMDYLLCCCRSKVRQKWVESTIAHNLKDIGFQCTPEQFQKLTAAQKQYLKSLDEVYRARDSMMFYITSSKEKATTFPEPFKTGLKNFHASWTNVMHRRHNIIMKEKQEKTEA